MVSRVEQLAKVGEAAREHGNYLAGCDNLVIEQSSLHSGCGCAGKPQRAYRRVIARLKSRPTVCYLGGLCYDAIHQTQPQC